MNILTKNSLTKFFLYGNYFYGLCAVALSMETVYHLNLPDYSPFYYLVVFCLTVVFYTRAYIFDGTRPPTDERNIWYARHKIFFKWSQATLLSLAITFVVLFLILNRKLNFALTSAQLIPLMVFPAVAILYYGVNSKLNLRKIGWLKPFIIGFAWSGIVSIFPPIFSSITNHTAFHLSLNNIIVFIINFIFVSALCILFDVKDIVKDRKNNLKTFTVSKGLNYTIYFVIIPLSLTGMLGYLLFGYGNKLGWINITMNLTPFILLIFAAFSLRRQRTLLYYLGIIDGLMVLKAVFGILAAKFF